MKEIRIKETLDEVIALDNQIESLFQEIEIKFHDEGLISKLKNIKRIQAIVLAKLKILNEEYNVIN
tara:strand:+ start:180 stop:377 length:198 start_codon:yes stop_codon:yes gene_type:complete